MGFWIAAGIAAFFLGLSKGGLSVTTMLAVPILSLYMDPVAAAGLLLPLYLIADGYAVYIFRKAFSVENLRILLPGAVVGVFVGYFAVTAVSTDVIKILLAGIGFAYLGTTLWRRVRKTEVPARPAEPVRGTILGALTGLTSYIAHSGGPPYQAFVLPQKLDKMVYLGTTTIFFAIVNLMKLGPFILAGQITWDSLTSAIWLAPVALAGAFTGALISKKLPERVFYILVEIALAIVSVKLLWDVIG